MWIMDHAPIGIVFVNMFLLNYTLLDWVYKKKFVLDVLSNLFL